MSKLYNAKFVYNLPYQPFLNPIEVFFSALKARYRALRLESLVCLIDFAAVVIFTVIVGGYKYEVANEYYDTDSSYSVHIVSVTI